MANIYVCLHGKESEIGLHPVSLPHFHTAQDRLKSLIFIMGKELAHILTRMHPSVLSLDSDVLRDRIDGLQSLLVSGYQGDMMGDGQHMDADSAAVTDVEDYVWQILEQRGDILMVTTAELQENFSSLTEALG